jgi:hypothetical protein
MILTPRCKSRSENDGLDSRTAKMSIKVDEVDGRRQAIMAATSHQWWTKSDSGDHT